MGTCTQKPAKRTQKSVLNPMSSNFLNDHSIVAVSDNLPTNNQQTTTTPRGVAAASAELQGDAASVKPSRSREQTTSSRINIKDVYRLGEVIGKGTFGKVRLAENMHGKVFAVKSIEKKCYSDSEDRLYLLRRELTIMKSMDHPNLVKFYETYHDEKYFHIVMEYVQGIDLWEFCERRLLPAGRVFSEKQVATIMRQLFNAISYMHSNSVIHRDLKPQNIIINETTLHVKILDFGLSRSMGEGANIRKLLSMVGTPLFVAPEMIKEQPYDGKVDVWSVGILMYYMLSCGQYPFENDSIKVLFKDICTREVMFMGQRWANVSWNAKDLIRKLLTVDPVERIELEDAGEHAWFDLIVRERRRKTVFGDASIKACVQNVLSFHLTTKLKYAILKILFNMTVKDAGILRRAYEAVDGTGNGMISSKELVRAAKEMGIHAQVEEVNVLFREINARSDGETKEEEEGGEVEVVEQKVESIRYSDFMLAAMDLKKALSKEKIEVLFAFFDKDCDGFISAADLNALFAQLGRKLSVEMVDEIIREVDVDENGSISKGNFFSLLQAEVSTQAKTRTSFSTSDLQ